ncbi:MAG: UDP-N-acetylmuramate--L-alanine ligase [Gemmatimonadaceae bacterium]|nr:UDP-N-acetylmuramate--L-alanine ligase [Gemmatimonadaceae bacterium]
MPLLDTTDPRPVHFVGVAGAGMSALAELFVRRGVPVTGCDAHLEDGASLARLGIALREGHDPAHVAGARALVVTSAMRRDHPELEAARASGMPIVRRAEALGEAVSGGTLVGIAGTHGKTTTTVMTTEALAAAGLHPTGVAGGRVGEWGGNLRYDGDRLFVVESDEYDRSFLALSPAVAVVTNIEADHLDIYRDLDDIRGAFEQFVAPAHTIVLCADDAGASSLAARGGAECLRYGTASPDARLVGVPRPLEDGRTMVAVTFDGEGIGDVTLAVPGVHNVRNALAAIGSGLALGATLEAMRPGLERFRGVERRFQRLGTASGVAVVDDYAHHPTEVAATIAAARAAFPGRRLVVAFQPHLYSRTRDFAARFAEALAAADACALLSLYPSREHPIPGVSSALIGDVMAAAGHAPVWNGDRADAARALAVFVREGDVVVTMGAGDVTRVGPELLHRLAAGSAA